MATRTLHSETIADQSIGEIISSHPDIWVLVEVTEISVLDNAVTRGRVLSASSDRAALIRPEIAFLDKHIDAECYVFFTGELIPSDMELAL